MAVDIIARAMASSAGSSTGVYKYKGSKNTWAELAALTNKNIGDVWNVNEAHGGSPAGTNWAWTGTEWDALGGSVDLSNYLAKNNTNAFIPTSDYNPSTKKYVDDSIATKQDTLVSGTNIKTINNNSLLGSGNITAADLDLEAIHIPFEVFDLTESSTSQEIVEAFTQTVLDKITDATKNGRSPSYFITMIVSEPDASLVAVVPAFVSCTVSSDESEKILTVIADTEGGSLSSVYIRYNSGSYSCISSEYEAYAATSTVLLKTNEVAYTPTGNYNPATKKYVDDAISASVTSLLGGDY